MIKRGKTEGFPSSVVSCVVRCRLLAFDKSKEKQNQAHLYGLTTGR